MGCCRRKASTNKTLLQQASSQRRRSKAGVVSSPKKSFYTPEKRPKPPLPLNQSLLCKHFEKHGAAILVEITPQRKVLFQASGSVFDLEENIELYGCTGTVPTLMKAIRRNIEGLKSAPTSKSISLGSLFAHTIDLLKKES